MKTTGVGWEYKVLKGQVKGFWVGGVLDVPEFEGALNDLGRQGWELVSMFNTSMGQGTSREVVATFKRPRTT